MTPSAYAPDGALGVVANGVRVGNDRIWLESEPVICSGWRPRPAGPGIACPQSAPGYVEVAESGSIAGFGSC